MIKLKEAEGMIDELIKEFLEHNENLLQCHKCIGQCHPRSIYQRFFASSESCKSALLCDKQNDPELDLPKLDNNFWKDPDKHDECWLYPEQCCYGTHNKCGWNGIFKDLTLHGRLDINSKTLEEIVHTVRACSDEYN